MAQPTSASGAPGSGLMIHHGQEISSVAATFVDALIHEAPHVGTSYYNLEKLPREQISMVAEHLLPVFTSGGKIDCSPEFRLRIGEWMLPVAYKFGYSFSSDQLSSVIVPTLQDIFESPSSLSQTHQSSLDRQRTSTVEVLAHLAPRLEGDLSDSVFEQLFEYVTSQERVLIRPLLALSQFERSLDNSNWETFERQQAAYERFPLILLAAVEAVADFKEQLSEPGGKNGKQFVAAAAQVHDACAALVLLSSVIDHFTGNPQVPRHLEEFVSDSQWLLTILNSPERFNTLAYEPASACKQSLTSLRIALAALAEADPALIQLVTEYKLPLNFELDPFGSLILKRAMGKLSGAQNRQLDQHISGTLSRIAPGSSCGPDTQDGRAVAMAVWRFQEDVHDQVALALRGRCQPQIQSFLYRADQC